MMATRNMLRAALALAAAGLVVAIAGTGYGIWLAALALLVVAAAVDGWLIWRRPKPTVSRTVDRSVPLGVSTDVELDVEFGDNHGGRIEVFDGVPAALGAADPSVHADIEPGNRLRVSYAIEPYQRGVHRFEPTYVREPGPLGLVARQIRVGDAEEVRVVPNFRAVSRYALMAVADKTSQIGVRELRRRGEGMEFDCLRDYREGDQLRQIDWKATARHNRVIARQYEDERNQQIVLAFDCGRRMRARDGELSHFDHALNAGLLLSYVALEQGDSVSVGTFGGVDRWVPDQRGPGAVESIVDRTFDLEATMEPSDFSTAARRLAQRQKRRALIIFLTNLYDADPDELQQALALLSERHLVMVASLREDAVDELAQIDIDEFDDALQVGATHHFREHRRRLHAQLGEAGGLLLDTTPSNLSVDLVNRYLQIKRAGEL